MLTCFDFSSDDGFSDKDEEKEEYFDRSAGYNSLSTFDSCKLPVSLK